MSRFHTNYYNIFIILPILISVVQSVLIVTCNGPIIGYEENGYTTFFGIPYAKVDEENPFGKSIEYPKFEKPFNANNSSIMCPQVYFNDAGILDCLRLNIYVPKTANVANLRPVLVWFHGGGLAFGSAGEYGGQHLVKHDIIVITVNYRLGPYGFFCLNDSTVPGNQGLKDQISALRWIKRNILSFGGDASKITIAGESYGGGGVDLHLYTKYETLFDKAIIQSGSVFAEGFYAKPDYEAAIKLAKKLGFQVNSTESALKLLAKVEPVKLMAATRDLELQFVVCKEKDFKTSDNFVITDPFHLNNVDKIKNKAIMIGYTSQEILYSYMFENNPQQLNKTLGNIFYDKLKKNFNMDETTLAEVSNKLKKFYLGNKEISRETVFNVSYFMSDLAVNHAAERSVNKYLTQDAKVYKYLFSYIGGSVYKNITGTGAMHTEELKYLFEWNSVRNKIEGDEQLMIRERITTLWANFVKFGNPTPEHTELVPITWSPVDNSSRPYLDIDVDMTMKNDVFQHRMRMWDEFWSKYEKNSLVYDNSTVS